MGGPPPESGQPQFFPVDVLVLPALIAQRIAVQRVSSSPTLRLSRRLS
jgi:hypothetical protein